MNELALHVESVKTTHLHDRLGFELLTNLVYRTILVYVFI